MGRAARATSGTNAVMESLFCWLKVERAACKTRRISLTASPDPVGTNEASRNVSGRPRGDQH
jgi:hypothetical protein